MISIELLLYGFVAVCTATLMLNLIYSVSVKTTVAAYLFLITSFLLGGNVRRVQGEYGECKKISVATGSLNYT